MSDSLTGRILGGCQLDVPLGQGGVSTTYKAHHLSLDLPVVVKVLEPKKVWGNPQLVQRFVEEGKALARLHHPNVVRVHSAGQEDDTPYLVLELVEGATLRARLRDGGVTPDTVVSWIEQAAEGLGAVHAEGLIHRDIKPDNLMVTGDQQVKLVDFGLALESGLADQPGSVLGTPAYMAPEQGMRQPLSPRSDVYSLGVTLYECLCDRWPFNAPEPRLLLKKHVHEQPPLEPLRERGLPEPLVELVARCLAKAPASRPADGAVFATELREAWELASSAVRRALPPRRRKGKRRRRRRAGSGSSAGQPSLGRRSSGQQLVSRRSSGSAKAYRGSTSSPLVGLVVGGFVLLALLLIFVMIS